MTKLQIAIATIVAILGGAAQAAGATRHCTTEEKLSADTRLTEIAANAALRDRLIRWHLRFGVPAATGPTDNERILVQGGYVMDHDDDLRTAVWVGYRLTAKDRIDAEGKERVNCFRPDPRIAAALAGAPSDYDEPVFDQGHMANDADLKDNLIEQLNSYVMSNMSPQECRFNRGIWLSLENLTRAWASTYDTVYVISGAIFDRNNDAVRDDDGDAVRMESRNGQARVAVPSHYYKVILRRDEDGFKSIAFLLEHTNDQNGATWAAIRPHIEDAVTTIEEIEDKADLHLYADLDRTKVLQSVAGAGWAMDDGDSNLENTCH